jgi:hypothetical protein
MRNTEEPVNTLTIQEYLSPVYEYHFSVSKIQNIAYFASTKAGEITA